MEQRVSLITIGVRNLEKSAAFYEALGYQPIQGETKVSHRKAIAFAP